MTVRKIFIIYDFTPRMKWTDIAPLARGIELHLVKICEKVMRIGTKS